MSGLREQLQAIYDERGELTPRAVVESATPRNHPLHGFFEWDNKVAGEKYRLHQAEEMIRSVRVTYTNQSGEVQRIRWWHPVRETTQVYDPLDVIANDPVSMQVLLRQADREWRQMKQRYGHLEEFWEAVRRDVA